MHNKTSKAFLPGILMLQIIATFLVVIGHSYPFVTPYPHWLYRAQVFLYCFHMPLFVWISGYLLVYSESSQISLRKFAWKRFIRLILPYIVLSIFAIFPKLFLSTYLNRGFSLDSESIIRAFLVPRENTWGHLWFLPMIFLLGILGYISDRYFFRKNNGVIGWAILTGILFGLYVGTFGNDVSGWFSISDIIRFGWYFALGGLCGTLGLNFKMNTPVSLGCFFLSLTGSIIIFNLKIPNSIYPYSNGLIALLMIFSILTLCNLISERWEVSRKSVFAATFTIFLLSWPFQAAMNVFAERIMHLPYYLLMPLQLLAGIIGPICILLILNQIEKKHNIKWISIVIGRQSNINGKQKTYK